VGIGRTKITVLKPAVFLDRDGTLNVQVIRDGKPYAPRELKDFTLFPNVIESCEALKKAGFLLVVATNQHRRKPEPGMLLDAAKALGIDLRGSWMVGDRWRDVDCGKRAGVKTVFIDFSYDEVLHAKPDFTVSSFKEAVSTILKASTLA
jgi:D-glycero-D-manno-heptose 1,7-bisphosphate phosphatase